MPRCKVGDLAFIVRDSFGDLGRLVEVVRPPDACEVVHFAELGFRIEHECIWLIRCVAGRSLNARGGKVSCAFIRDECLRPLPKAPESKERSAVPGTWVELRDGSWIKVRSNIPERFKPRRKV